MPQIVFNFKRDGSVVCKTSGFRGSSCMDATAEIEKALGMVETEKKTEEYYLPNVDLAHIQNIEGEEEKGENEEE